MDNQQAIINKTILWYADALSDIANRINLKQRLDEVDTYIKDLEIAKERNISNSPTSQGFNDLRNELFRLRYEILEEI